MATPDFTALALSQLWSPAFPTGGAMHVDGEVDAS
jgi:hypothetical protein